MRGIKYILGVIMSLCLCFAAFVGLVESVVFDMEFYRAQFERLNISSSSGIAPQELETATMVLLDYLRGRSPDMDYEAEVFKVRQEVFNKREKSHMVDVRNLYRTFSDIRTAGWVCSFILFVALAVLLGRRFPAVLIKSLLMTLGCLIVILGTVGLFAALDFETFWTNFHHIFFSNELWLLDPSRDILIRIVPQMFFSAAVQSIVLRIGSLLVSAVSIGLLALGLARKRRRRLIGDEV